MYSHRDLFEHQQFGIRSFHPIRHDLRHGDLHTSYEFLVGVRTLDRLQKGEIFILRQDQNLYRFSNCNGLKMVRLVKHRQFRIRSFRSICLFRFRSFLAAVDAADALTTKKIALP